MLDIVDAFEALYASNVVDSAICSPNVSNFAWIKYYLRYINDYDCLWTLNIIHFPKKFEKYA